MESPELLDVDGCIHVCHVDVHERVVSLAALVTYRLRTRSYYNSQ